MRKRNVKRDWFLENVKDAAFSLAGPIVLCAAIALAFSVALYWPPKLFSNQKQHTMKKCTLVYSENQVDKVTTFLAENGIVTLVSYMKEGGFFDKNIVQVICFKDDLEDKVKANLNSFIKEKK